MKAGEQFGRQIRATGQHRARRGEAQKVPDAAQHQQIGERGQRYRVKAPALDTLRARPMPRPPAIEPAAPRPGIHHLCASTPEACISHCRGVNIRNSGPTSRRSLCTVSGFSAKCTTSGASSARPKPKILLGRPGRRDIGEIARAGLDPQAAHQPVAVVEDEAMRQHRRLRTSRGARGVAIDSDIYLPLRIDCGVEPRVIAQVLRLVSGSTPTARAAPRHSSRARHRRCRRSPAAAWRRAGIASTLSTCS